jgi:RNA polymerase sigma factor (sigma-70 family)
MDSDADAALVQAALDGSQQAFSRLVDRYQQALRAFLWRIVDTRDEADDLAQETFLAAWSGLGEWRGRSSVRTWLFAIAWRKATSARRALNRRRARDRVHAERSALETPHGASQAEESLALRNALAALSFEQRAAVSLCLGGDFSHADAAAILKLPLGTVKSHVTRGRARLLMLLECPP